MARIARPTDDSAPDCIHCETRLRAAESEMSQEAIAELKAQAAETSFDARAVIFGEGRPAEYVYRVRSGVVRLIKSLQDGRRQVVGFAYPGDFVGFALEPEYVLSAEVVRPVVADRLSQARFDAFLSAHPRLLMRFTDKLARDVRASHEQIVSLGRRTAEERVISFLAELRDRLACARGREATLQIPMPGSDIADYLGLSKETVSRAMNKLANDGRIQIVAGGARVLDRAALDAAAPPRRPLAGG